MNRYVRWGAGIACIIFVAGLFVEGAKPVAVGLIPVPWDKLAHAVAFGGLAVLVELALAPPTWLLFALPLAVSAADEIHQIFLPGRSAGIDDWLAGAAGVTLVWWLLRRTRLRRYVEALLGTPPATGE